MVQDAQRAVVPPPRMVPARLAPELALGSLAWERAAAQSLPGQNCCVASVIPDSEKALRERSFARKHSKAQSLVGQGSSRPGRRMDASLASAIAMLRRNSRKNARRI
jgi:hypothetical protein